MRARSFTAPLAAAVLVLAAACGGDEPGSQVASVETPADEPAAAQSVDDLEKAVERYRDCLSENGVELRSGTIEGDGAGPGGAATIQPAPDQPAPQPVSKEQLAAAEEKCRQFRPNGGIANTPDAEMLDKQRAWVRCLRGKGFDVPDPSPDGNGGVRLPSTPEANQAVADCGAEVYGAGS